jgi:hypothetical protein
MNSCGNSSDGVNNMQKHDSGFDMLLQLSFTLDTNEIVFMARCFRSFDDVYDYLEENPYFHAFLTSNNTVRQLHCNDIIRIEMHDAYDERIKRVLIDVNNPA